MHNFDSLHNLLSELDLDFDIVAVFETWNPKQKEHNFRAGNLKGYHKYIGQSCNTVKIGCGLYIKETLKFKERKTLDIAFHDDNNEYQTKWIEMINQNQVNILIGVVYRYPRRTSDSHFTTHL